VAPRGRPVWYGPRVDLRATLLAACWNDDGQFDVGRLSQRLLLFDRYIIKSTKLTELPRLIEVFGPDGTAMLLNSGAVGIECSAITVGDVGGIHQLPHFSYGFEMIKGVDYNRWIEKWLAASIRSADVGKYNSEKLTNAVRRSLKAFPSDFGAATLKGLSLDLGANVPGIRRTVVSELERILMKPVQPDDVHLIVHEEGNRRYTMLKRIS
jgi:hypothetical protein